MTMPPHTPRANAPVHLPLREVSAPAPAPALGPEPYRLMFTIGTLYAILGAAPWILDAFGLIPYPAVLHRTLMMEGFELSFVLGFLLTALPAMTRGERCRPWERNVAAGLAVLLGACALAGLQTLAHLVFVAAVVHLAVASLRRAIRAPLKPAEEFLFVALGLLFGIAGGIVQAGTSAGLWTDPALNFGARLVSLGMVLSLVSGVGALLVPTFIGLRDPLLIPGVARAHERHGRRGLYVVFAVLYISAFLFEAAGHPAVGAWLRAGTTLTLLFWVWKVWRLPGRRDRYGYALWASAWCLGLGLLLAALLPGQAVAAYHITFVGGYGLLTLGIATRVVASHGKHPPAFEPRLHSGLIVGAIVAALALRFGAAWVPPRGAPHVYALAAALWIVAWGAWLARGIGSESRQRRVAAASGAARRSRQP